MSQTPFPVYETGKNVGGWLASNLEENNNLKNSPSQNKRLAKRVLVGRPGSGLPEPDRSTLRSLAPSPPNRSYGSVKGSPTAEMPPLSVRARAQMSGNCMQNSVRKKKHEKIPVRPTSFLYNISAQNAQF